MFHIISTPTNHIILGFPWLQSHNTVLSWKEGELINWSPYCQHHCLRKLQTHLCLTTTVESPDIQVNISIPKEYQDLREVFSKERARLFVENKDGALGPRIDYRGLNVMTTPYLYPLPLSPTEQAERMAKLTLYPAVTIPYVHPTAQHISYHLPDINVSFSSGYHPQSNGRLNQEISRYLLSYCSREQQHWSEFLPWAKYAQNSLTHSSTGLTPFQCVLGYQPPWFPWSEEPSEVPAMDDWSRRSQEVWKSTHVRLQHTSRCQRIQSARHRHAHPRFQVLITDPLPEVLLFPRIIEASYLCYLVYTLRRDLIGCSWSRSYPEESRRKQIPPDEATTDDEGNIMRAVQKTTTITSSTTSTGHRPGLTTTAIGAVNLQGAGGNWATVGRRSRGGRIVHRQREKRKGKGRELADMMERRKVDILCVQETRWKGSKARSIGARFKLFYYGVDSKRNGVGVVLKEEFVRNVLEVGCELEEKERFWSELDEVMESIPTGERVVIGADFNGHVGEGNTGDEEVMGKFGVKERNLEGQMVVDFAKRMDMAVVNTYFQKREEHRVTYKSGGRRTQKLRQALGGQVVLPNDWETTADVLRKTGRKVLGVSSGRRKEDKETWWWNEDIQDSIQRKRLAKKKWDMDRTEENRQEYKELQCRVKREVSKAKQKAYDELYTRLDTREGQKDLYRFARQRDRDGKDVQQLRVIKDRDGRVLTSEESVQRRWKEYFEELMNEENEMEKRVEGVNSGTENLEKAYDRVPREELWYRMRKSGVAEKGESREQVEETLERWRFVLERRGMKDAASLPLAEDGPNLTFIFIFILAGTCSASLLIGGGDRRPHLPPSLWSSAQPG
ncbi:hypothetical protein QTP86_028677 [Hemibagrus guttatus]|nr:hypothetical protein QTP86_028677 [Hemibagrus guttatus]